MKNNMEPATNNEDTWYTCLRDQLFNELYMYLPDMMNTISENCEVGADGSKCTSEGSHDVSGIHDIQHRLSVLESSMQQMTDNLHLKT